VGGITQTGVFPFELGVPFQATLSLVNTAGGSSPGSDASILVRFLLLEQDGKTPVDVFVTPEPRSVLLMLLGIGGTAVLLRSQRTQE
jgi:hypothetical protein